jgi:hypothetical protein
VSPAGPLLYGSYAVGSEEWWAQRALRNNFARTFFRDALEIACGLPPANDPRRALFWLGDHCMGAALEMAGLPV